MTGSSWPATPTTTPTLIQRKSRYVAIGKGGSHIFFWEVEEYVDNDEIQEEMEVNTKKTKLQTKTSLFSRLEYKQIQPVPITLFSRCD